MTLQEFINNLEDKMNETLAGKFIELPSKDAHDDIAHLGFLNNQEGDVDSLKTELQAAQSRIAELQDENAALRKAIRAMQAGAMR